MSVFADGLMRKAQRERKKTLKKLVFTRQMLKNLKEKLKINKTRKRPAFFLKL